MPRDSLYAWYTDFSPRDAEIMRTYGTGSLLERNVEQLDDRHLVLTQRMTVMGRTIPTTIRIALEPENFAYRAHLQFAKLASQRRLYRFLKREGGSTLHMEVEYTPESLGVRVLDALGLLRRLDLKESRGITLGYLRAAEAELLPRGRP